MSSAPVLPSLERVRQVSAVRDPIIRNLQITQCYHDLAEVLAWRTGASANWCTFATWASKQAGQSIRKEDLKRLLEGRLKKSPAALRSAEGFAAAAGQMGAAPVEDSHRLILHSPVFLTAIDRTSAAVSRGNQKVFQEIGFEFARFYQACIHDQTPDPGKIDNFCEQLLPGMPPDGQAYLRQAFRRYYRALFEPDPHTRAQLIFLANIEIGFHEQTRLQPEILESLDAGFVNLSSFTRLMVATLFPISRLSVLSNIYIRRLLGRPTPLDVATQSLHASASALFRHTITEVMMTIALPGGIILRLGQDLGSSFPGSLQHITDPDLDHFLKEHDPTPDSTLDSGALDWGSLPDRLHFIIDFFRCCQENEDLFQPPFSPEQVQDFNAGRLPSGRL